ncbi:type II secretion system protein GspM [Xanthobacter agilis]|uniref:General secretion pathway protein M n=1 Tax=Xanthobacter agilis TaxID=47492 RepID=A0ABU0L856_XANAG|nr:type II secretion system protein GspM [Xanthobacter agilis]MDQ0503333.1 general secretion pathway protein M [Xanthobacter agilis]
MSLAPSKPPMGPRPLLAGLAYGGLVLLLLFIAADAVRDMTARRGAVDEAAATLAQLQARRGMPGSGSGGPAGSPFLDGATLTIAGAGLMQRLSSAVADAGGRITSSQVALRDTPYGPDFIAVEASLEIAQADLQKLLYDLESGLPFLFVGQLAARPVAARAPGDGDPQRLHVTLTVYGQWRGTP